MAKLPQYFKLWTGAKMPAIGLGTFQTKAPSDIERCVEAAINVGYRHIDTANSYGNEANIGDTLQRCFRRGDVKREDLFLTTKIPSNRISGEEAVLECAEESLASLKVSYVDMLLIHMPFGFVPGPDNLESSRLMRHYDIVTAYRALEGLYKSGRARAIGISNFTTEQIDRVWNQAKVKPANLQLECHAYLQQDQLRQYCKEKGLVVTAYCPLGAYGRPPWQRLEGDRELITDPEVKAVARSIGLSEGQVLLRFLMQLGLVPLPKSVNPARLRENLEALTGDLSLSDEHMRRLRAINCNQKYFRFLWASTHPEFSTDQPF